MMRPLAVVRLEPQGHLLYQLYAMRRGTVGSFGSYQLICLPTCLLANAFMYCSAETHRSMFHLVCKPFLPGLPRATAPTMMTQSILHILGLLCNLRNAAAAVVVVHPVLGCNHPAYKIPTEAATSAGRGRRRQWGRLGHVQN